MKDGDWRVNRSPSMTPEGRRLHYNKIRDKALKALGDKCVNCGFSDPRALHIDHIFGDGGKDRRSKRGISYYYHILNTLHENRYQLLCANCNYIKRIENGEMSGQNSG